MAAAGFEGGEEAVKEVFRDGLKAAVDLCAVGSGEGGVQPVVGTGVDGS